MDKLRLQRNAALTAYLLSLGALMPVVYAAEPALDFQLINKTPTAVNGLDVYCAPSATYYDPRTCVRGSADTNGTRDPDYTPFVLERFINPEGIGYYHVMIGDNDSTFQQEYFIEYSGSGSATWPNGFRLTASSGAYNGGPDAMPAFTTAPFYLPLDPNENRTGNATGRPDRVIFKQVIRQESANPSPMNGPLEGLEPVAALRTEGTPAKKVFGFEQITLKSKLREKPTITQYIEDKEMISDFKLDMSGIAYTGPSAMTTSGIMKNTLKVIDAKTGWIASDFDMSRDSQKSTVNGGRYSYANGMGQGGSFGTYTYATSTFDIYSVDWKSYLNANENFDVANTIPNY